MTTRQNIKLHADEELHAKPQSDQLVNSAVRILRGFMRMFIGRIAFDVIVDILRRVAVEEGCRRVAQENNGKVILSRVAMLTGVRMQQVKELMNEPFTCDESDLTLESRILTRWANSDEYHDSTTKKPIDLLILGSGQTFQRLVTSVAGRGVTTQTALDKLTESGNVEIINQHWVRLINPYWELIKYEDSEMIDIGSFNLENHFNTIIHNIKSSSVHNQRRVERSTWSVSLPKDKIPQVRDSINEILKSAHKECALEIRRNESTGSADMNHTLIGAGLYQWERITDEEEGYPVDEITTTPFISKVLY